MSVFHVHEWLALELNQANVCAVGELIENRDQLVVGSITGRLWIIDPGQATDTKQQLSCLLEEELSVGILDIAIANFISGTEQNLIAILSQQKLTIYQFLSDGEANQLIILHEHTLSTIAYNMCIGRFGRATISQICIQDMNCSLMIFEAEQELFHRSLNALIGQFPGPIIYASNSDSIITASSSAILISYRYSTLATVTSTDQKYGKKIPANWIFSLGDYPLDLAVIDTSLVQPSIIILCKRTLFCLTHGGTLRFTYRLQSVALSLLVYDSTHDAYVQFCITTANRMLLFFKDTILVWAAQLLYDAIQVRLCTFSAVCRSMLVILSNSRISVSYLGTEPSLFRLPAPQTRFIDFQQRHKEFMELEALIRKKPLELIDDTTAKNSLSLNCSFGGLDFKSRGEKSSQIVPSLMLNIELVSSVRLLDVKLTCSTAFHIDHKYVSFPAIDGSEKLSTSVYIVDEPIYDLRCKLFAFSSQFGFVLFPVLFMNMSDLISKEIKMPLNLMCHQVTAQRNAQCKITIESSLAALEIAQLFPERYRIQSEKLNFIYLFTDELIRRVQEKQSEVKLNCTLPLDHILHQINVYVEQEKRKESDEKELERLSILLRKIQAAILTKLKAEHPVEVDYMNTLFEYTYQQLLCCMDRLEQLNAQLHTSSLSLSAALNLLHLITSLKGNPLPLDGSIIKNSGQSVWERIKWIISTFQPIDLNIDLSSNDLRNLLRNSYENTTISAMANIYEDSRTEADDDEDADDEPERIPCAKEGAKIDLADVTRGLVTSPCYHCMCKNGLITCLLEKCHPLTNCPTVWDRNNKTCCMQCLHCMHLGIKRVNNQIWTSAQDVCTQISCKAGIITSWRIQCISNCSNGRILAGYCCSLCLTPSAIQDRCVRCDLVLNQWYHCYRFTCPVLNCPVSQHITHPKRCCPECKTYTVLSERSNLSVSNGSHCFFRGWLYSVYDTFRIDPCSRCSCQPGGIICQRFVCPVEVCDLTNVFYKPNVCCPFCYKKENSCRRSDISGNEITVKHGTKWTFSGNCSNCICINGLIKCKKMDCLWKGKCPSGRYYKQLNGSCCHECELKESSCTVFGDPHYVTFDKFGYSFQGACSYILAQMCSNNGILPQFKIIGVNGGKPPLTWTRRIVIYISLFNGTFFTVHLLPKKVIREHTRIITIPYVRYSDWPEYRAYEDPNTGHIVVSFKFIGLKVIWDGESFAEIILTKRYQSKVCGLCGNFNDNPNDDMIPRYGNSLTYSVSYFARSWAHDDGCSIWHQKTKTN
uniref:Uncharacterized protein n=1 Tax=Setaria digitata TaxID=48799 RepID=A0A915PMZ1_9BILA